MSGSLPPRLSRAALRKAGVVLPAINSPDAKAVAKGVPRSPAMNKTEARYGELLAIRQRAGEVRAYWFEGMTLALGEGARFTPDYMVLMADWTIELHEVKGFMREAALVRLKVAARMYPFVFRVVKRAKKGTADFAFEIAEVKP